jgi:Abnormal spindle-like microcephaly-assoc'd, ASPM-SPD-2-Hydin
MFRSTNKRDALLFNGDKHFRALIKHWIIVAMSLFIEVMAAKANATLVVNQQSLDFGLVTVGNTALDQTVTVRNASATPLTISSVASPGSPFSLQSNTCTTLAPSASCTITYDFAPTAGGLVSSASVISSSVGSLAVNLRGAGRAPTFPLAVSATDFDFGDVGLGTTSPGQRVLVRNISGASVSFTVAGGGAGAIFGGSGDCGGTPKVLAAGATCYIEYRFRPDAFGEKTGGTSLTVNYDTQSRNYNFSFKGVGVSPVRVSATKFLFGDVAAGTTSPGQRVIIENISNASLSFQLAGGGAGRFGGSSDCGGSPKVLAVGASCYIEYRFTPDALGPVTGSTSFSLSMTTGGASINFPINFEGNGIFPLRVASRAIDFGDVVVGSASAAHQLQITNTANASVSFTAAGGGGGSFGGGTTCGGNPKVLAAGASCVFQYQVTPSAAGVATGGTGISLTIGSGSTSISQSYSFAFKVNGVANAASQFPLTVALTAFDFGNVALGTGSPGLQAVVTNVSAASVSFTAAGGGAGSLFNGSGGVGGTSCGGNPKVLAAGATCFFEYGFTPTALGPATGSTSFSLTVVGSGASRSFPLSFSGNGMFPLLLSPTRFDFSNVAIGQGSPGQRIVVTNTTASSISFTAAGGSAGSTFNGGSGVGGTSCGGSPKVLAAGASCFFEYGFVPSALGEVSGSTGIGLTVGSVTRSFGSADLTFKGNGIFPLLLSPLKFDFGDVAVGSTSADQSIVVSNVTNATTAFTAAGGSGGALFSGGTSCGGNPKSLAIGTSCSFNYSFAPKAIGPVAGGTTIFLTVLGISKIYGSNDLIFNGNGTGFGPSLQVSPYVLDFGPVKAGDTSPTVSVTVRNVGNAALNGVSVGTPPNAQFLAGGSCPATLAAGASCTLTYLYNAPSTFGEASTLVQIASAAGGAGIVLRARSVPPVIAFDIDGNGACTADTDALLVMRYLAGLRGDALVADVPFAAESQRVTADEIANYLNAIASTLDIDEDTQTNATTDGLLFLRHLKSMTGSALVNGARAPRPDTTVRSDSEITNYLTQKCAPIP